MAKKTANLAGMKLGDFTIEKQAAKDIHGKTRFLVRCDKCGDEQVIYYYLLKLGYLPICDTCGNTAKGVSPLIEFFNGIEDYDFKPVDESKYNFGRETLEYVW